MAKIVVSSGLYDDEKRWIDEEGEVHIVAIAQCRVGFSTPYGLEYTHRHAFPNTEAGRLAAERLARRVQSVIDAKGPEGLNDGLWVTRVIYGSAAYCDEEPYIVAREKADDLMFGD